MPAKRKWGKPTAVVTYRQYWYEEIESDLVAGLSFLEREDVKFHSIVKWRSETGQRSERRIELLPAQLKALLQDLDESKRSVKQVAEENSILRQEIGKLCEVKETLQHDLELLKKQLQEQNQQIISLNARRAPERNTPHQKSPMQVLEENASARRAEGLPGGLPSLGRRR